MEEFDNENRTRYYGLRIGDFVKYSIPGDELHPDTYEVIRYGFMDNNRVVIQSQETGKQISVVAEWCRIITKVEERNSK